MTDADLREIAEKATPGEWSVDGGWAAGAHIHVGDRFGDKFTEVAWLRSYMLIPDNEVKANAAFIAAFNPATALALLDRLERAEKALKPFAEIADLMDLETTGFAPCDALSLICRDDEGEEVAHFMEFEVADFYRARSTLTKDTSNDE